MIQIDKNFKAAINILSSNKIFYWVGHGSLLGIKRENKLIEWDHDIDLCIWDKDNKREKVIKILEENGFKYRSDLGFGKKFDQMSFDKAGGRRVDINFYLQGETKSGEKIAFIKWGYVDNFFMKILNAISNSENYKSRFSFVIKKLKFLQPAALKFKKLLIEKNFFYKFAGYQQPMRLLNDFEILDFHGIKINIPSNSEKYLEYIYGSNWRTPIKKFNWWKTKNLKND